MHAFAVNEDAEHSSLPGWQTDAQAAALNDFHADVHRRELVAIGRQDRWSGSPRLHAASEPSARECRFAVNG